MLGRRRKCQSMWKRLLVCSACASAHAQGTSCDVANGGDDNDVDGAAAGVSLTQQRHSAANGNCSPKTTMMTSAASASRPSTSKTNGVRRHDGIAYVPCCDVVPVRRSEPKCKQQSAQLQLQRGTAAASCSNTSSACNGDVTAHCSRQSPISSTGTFHSCSLLPQTQQQLNGDANRHSADANDVSSDGGAGGGGAKVTRQLSHRESVKRAKRAFFQSSGLQYGSDTSLDASQAACTEETIERPARLDFVLCSNQPTFVTPTEFHRLSDHCDGSSRNVAKACLHADDLMYAH